MVGEYQTAFLVRLSSNRYCHPSVFEREVGIGWRVRPLVRTPFPGRRESPVLDGRANHRGARPRPRDPDGVPTIRGRQEAGPAPVRLLRAHGHGRERLPSRARPRTVPPRHLHGVQTGLPTRLRSVQESALRESRRQGYRPEVVAKGPETFVHLVPRAPKPVPGEWTDFWNGALESLRAFLESSAPVSE